MKVTIKEPYEAEQFNPKHGVPNYVVDVLRSTDLRMLRARGYEWGVERADYTVTGINVGDWVVNNGNDHFVFTNEQFHQTFKEVSE